MQNEVYTKSQPPQAPDLESSILAKKIVRPLYESLFWIRLFALCLIFYGGLITVTGIGILVAWIPMWIGVLLLMAGRTIKVAFEDDNTQALVLSILRLKTIFTILGVSSIMLIAGSIYLVIYAFDKSLF